MYGYGGGGSSGRSSSGGYGLNVGGGFTNSGTVSGSGGHRRSGMNADVDLGLYANPNSTNSGSLYGYGGTTGRCSSSPARTGTNVAPVFTIRRLLSASAATRDVH